ncbi:MAG: hypothetical protein QOF48_3211 [Verrucomicrobiota bacterium]|jgi:hypothetical protein
MKIQMFILGVLSLAGGLLQGAEPADTGVPVFVAPPSAENAPKAAAVENQNGAGAVAGEVRLSAGLDEIVRLNKAGVEESVILAFIQASPISYHPTAREILLLREKGISSAVLTTMLRHVGEVRPAVQAPPPQTTPAAPPVPEPVRVQSTAVYYNEPVVYSPSPAVVYAPYPYYGYGYGYGYGYPRYSSCYSGSAFYGGFFPGVSLRFGFGGGHSSAHFGSHVSSFSGGFRGGFHGGHR